VLHVETIYRHKEGREIQNVGDEEGEKVKRKG
jgi:hypothetical protein